MSEAENRLRAWLRDFGHEKTPAFVADLESVLTELAAFRKPAVTMRELLDVLKTATPEERREFSRWWTDLPIADNIYRPNITGFVMEAITKTSVAKEEKK